MSEINKAIAARQTHITQLQRDIETLQRAANIMGGRTKTPAKATSQPKASLCARGMPLTCIDVALLDVPCHATTP